MTYTECCGSSKTWSGLSQYPGSMSRIGGVEAPVQVPVSVIPPPPMRPALPPPPASSLPQAAFKLGGQSRPQMGAPGFGGAQHGPTPGPGPPGFARGPAAVYPMSGMGDERFGGPGGGLPPAPGHFGMNLPGPPPLGVPSQHSLIDDILGKKSIKDRQQTEKCVTCCAKNNPITPTPLLMDPLVASFI